MGIVIARNGNQIQCGQLGCGRDGHMAGGWTRDGAVQDQIDDTVKDAVLRARALTPKGESAEECDDCGEPIPKKRREALPGVRTCVVCQSERDKAVVHSTINRRGSKDSQLR
jgi:phage/conjugal plasmid C-4 type zinc finger TraR family protein